MIRRGDLLRVPYTGTISEFRVIYVVRICVSTFVLSSTMFTLLKPCVYISVLCLVFICRCLVVRFSEIVVRLGPGSIVRS